MFIRHRSIPQPPPLASSYIIPPPVTHHFLHDVDANGRYTGFPSLGLLWQKTEALPLRQRLGMTAVAGASSGVLIRRVEPTAPSSSLLRAGDVLLSFDGVAIANDGTVPFRAGERIAFSYLVSQKYSGATAVVRVLRDGRVHSVTTALAGAQPLVPVHTAGAPPSYFVWGGLVFTPCSVPFLKSEYGREYDFEGGEGE